MGGLLPAVAAGIARALMAFAAGHGVDLGSDQADTLAQAVLIVAPIVWSVVHKVKVSRVIERLR